MKITTKRFYAGEYKVYRDGVFAGTITNGASESKEWTAFDENNEWIGTVPTKRVVFGRFGEKVATVGWSHRQPIQSSSGVGEGDQPGL